MGLMSIESQEAVKCHKDYVALKLMEDPNDLCKLIVDTPLEKFSGQKLDAKVHLRCGFFEYVQATVPYADNTLTTPLYHLY